MKRSPMSPAPDARVLVICSARIGDTLLVTPLLRAVKACSPRGVVGCLAHPKRLELLRGLPFIDHLAGITASGLWLRGRLHRTPPWDYALVVNHERPFVEYALRVARQVVGFHQGDPLLNARLAHGVDLPPGTVAVAGRLALGEAIGITTDDQRLAYRVTPGEEGWAARWLEEQGLGGIRPLVGFQPCSFPTKAYRDWPVEHFARLAERVLGEHPRARLLVLGGPENAGVAADFAARFPGRAVAVAGRFTLRQSAALMARLHLYVGVDTGPTHLAGALGIPMVALYHCRFRGRALAPRQHPGLRVIEHLHDDAHCTPESPMALIPVEEVWRAVAELLGSRGDGPPPTGGEGP